MAAEVRDGTNRLEGVRPLGGGVNFGERWQAALAREFNEELGVDIVIKGEPLVMENIFVHEGSVGHEVVFVSDVEIRNCAFSEIDNIEFKEASGAPGIAGWFDLAALDLDDGPKLFPAGLKDLLLGRR